MTRGFLSEGSGRSRDSEGDGFVTVDLELGWSTEKGLGFRDPFRKDRAKGSSGGSREELIWVPKAIKGVPLVWEGPSTGAGKLSGPRWLLEKAGLL